MDESVIFMFPHMPRGSVQGAKVCVTSSLADPILNFMSLISEAIILASEQADVTLKSNVLVVLTTASSCGKLAKVASSVIVHSPNKAWNAFGSGFLPKMNFICWA